VSIEKKRAKFWSRSNRGNKQQIYNADGANHADGADGADKTCNLDGVDGAFCAARCCVRRWCWILGASGHLALTRPEVKEAEDGAAL